MPLNGLIAAPHTPFDADGQVSPAGIDRLAEHLHTAAIDGVFVCGTTGEGMSLTTSERKAVTERWVQAAAGRYPVVVHVGHASGREARHLAAHASAVGAAAVAAVAPFYHKPADVRELAAALVEIGSAAPGVPFYFYDIPSFTGVRVPTADLMDHLADALPSFAGVKFSNPDLVLLQECLTVRSGSLDVLFGVDEMLLAGWALGVRGAVGSTYNFAAPLYRRMIAAFDAGDWDAARKLQRQSVAVVRALERFGGLSANKAVMALLGIDCGPTRPPLRPLEPAERVEFGHHLAELGFFSPDVSGASPPG
jgi:N-acetylneuraminate lyase